MLKDRRDALSNDWCKHNHNHHNYNHHNVPFPLPSFSPQPRSVSHPETNIIISNHFTRIKPTHTCKPSINYPPSPLALPLPSPSPTSWRAPSPSPSLTARPLPPSLRRPSWAVWWLVGRRTEKAWHWK
ncbi:hypothetical protein BC937DRAFT_93410 [Endogone sp. FLAS-F59071]|nr:hypothetical protein BC937DRAFT_93410 [Endogone sp. FLAS-F59071]|eukprot:RUS14738.1 hypothetical protein BC937DRAFT_93410 [Endogone sp. FLAS-F59071]